MSEVEYTRSYPTAGAVLGSLVVSAAVISAVSFGAFSPIIAYGLAIVAAIAALSLYFPAIALVGFVVIVVTNAAAVASFHHGAPPIGGLFVPSLLALLLLRRAAGLEDLSVSVYLLLPVGIYVVVNALGLLWVDEAAPTIEYISGLVKNLAIVVVMCGLITTRARFQAVVAAIGFSVAGLAAISVFQYATGTFNASYFGFSTATVKNIAGEIDNWRSEGPLQDPNYYGQLLLLGLPVVVALAAAARSWGFRAIALLGVPLILVAVFFTFSRGALASLVGLAVITVFLSRQRLVIAMAALATLIIVTLAAPSLFFQRLLPIFGAIEAMANGSQAVSDPALSQRLAVMRAGIAIFESNPFTGIGAGQFQYNYERFALEHGLDLGAPSQAHNRYIELAAEQGVIGLTAFFGIIAATFGMGIAAIRNFRNAGQRTEVALIYGLLLGLVGYLMTAVFLHDDYTRVFWLYISLLISAYAISLRGDFRKKQDDVGR